MQALRLGLIVLLGYGLAVIVAPILVLLVQSVLAGFVGDPMPADSVPTFLLMGTMITAIYSAPPFLCAIGLMRWLKRRDWPSHGSAGAVVAYAALAIFSGGLVPANVSLLPFLLAGAGAGFVYWLCRRRFGWIPA